MSTVVCKPLNLNKMSKEKARVLIAKDVLARLRYRKVTTGYYLRNIEDITISIQNKENEKKGKDYNDTWMPMNDIDARKHVVKLEKECPACALGNMMLSHIRLFDKVNLDQIECGDRSDITNVLEDYFDGEQLDLIEAAFESNSNSSSYYDDSDDDKARSYYRKYNEPKQRLRAIMLNIVKNKGTFKPDNFWETASA